MNQKLVDTIGFGFLLWLIGYFMGFFIITIPGYPEIMTIPVILTAFSLAVALVTAAFTYVRFRKRREVSWLYAFLVGITWTILAIVLDFIFIVLLFNAPSYYRPHIFTYYAITLVVPSAVAKYSSRQFSRE